MTTRALARLAAMALPIFFSLTASAAAAPVAAAATATVAAAQADEEAGPEHGKINMPDASPVDPGHFEVEAIYSYGSSNKAWDRDGNKYKRGLTSEHAGALSFTAGVIDNLDVAVSSSYDWLRDQDNDYDGDGNSGPTTGDDFGDVNVNARYRFIRNDSYSLDVAYIGGFTIPTGTRGSESRLGTSQEFWSFNQTLAASKDWGMWTANADAGYALPFGDRKGATHGAFNADLGGGYQVLPWLQPEVELNYARDFVADADDSQTLAATMGFVMPISEHLRVNAGVQQAFWGLRRQDDNGLHRGQSRVLTRHPLRLPALLRMAPSP